MKSHERTANAMTAIDARHSVTIRMPTSRYFDEFISLHCASDMLELGLFPNAKEITESFACYNAVRTRLKHLDRGDPYVSVVVVGDGYTPRTAALFAFLTRWTCYSVDPALGKNGKADRWSAIQRLHIKACKIEDAFFQHSFYPTVIVCPHSHAPLQSSVDAVTAEERCVVTIPCCIEHQTVNGLLPDMEYADWGVWSPHRLVRIWRDI